MDRVLVDVLCAVLILGSMAAVIYFFQQARRDRRR